MEWTDDTYSWANTNQQRRCRETSFFSTFPFPIMVMVTMTFKLNEVKKEKGKDVLQYPPPSFTQGFVQVGLDCI